MIYSTRSYIEGLAEALAEKGNVTLIEGNKWSTDLVTRTITYDLRGLLATDYRTARGAILHEIGHLNYSSILKKEELDKKYPSLGFVYNVLEDIRIEKLLVDTYKSFAIEGFREFYTETAFLHGQRPDGFSKMSTLQVILFLLNSTFIRSFYGASYITIKINGRWRTVTPIDYFLINPLETELSKRDHGNATKAHDQAVEKVARAYSGFESTGEVKEFSDRVLFPILEKYLKEESQTQATVESLSHALRKFLGSPTGSKTQEETIPTDTEIEALYRPQIYTLVSKLTQILKEKKATRHTGSHKRGKLLSKNAYKVLTGEKRIFSRKTNPNFPSYSISLVLDESGSMDGTKHVNSYIAAFIIGRVAEKLQFKINTVIFQHTVRVENFRKYREANFGGNDDQEATRVTHNLLNFSDDNLVFILSDGGVETSPTANVELMRKKGATVVPLGVGLKGEEFSQLETHYHDAINIENVEDLPKVMIAHVRKFIHR